VNPEIEIAMGEDRVAAIDRLMAALAARGVGAPPAVRS
jgi:hypothetical protein